jgi:hypothetical protein
MSIRTSRPLNTKSHYHKILVKKRNINQKIIDPLNNPFIQHIKKIILL